MTGNPGNSAPRRNPSSGSVMNSCVGIREGVAPPPPLPGAIGGWAGGQALSSVRPLSQGQALSSVRPLSQGQSLSSVRPLSQGQALSSVRPSSQGQALSSVRPLSRVEIPPTVLAWWVAVCALNPSSVRPCYLLVGNPGSWPCPVSVRSHPAGPAGSVAEYRNPPFPRDTGPGGWTGPVSLGNEQFPRPATDGPPPRQGRAAPDAGAGVRRWMPAPSIVHGPAPGSVGFKNWAKWIARAVARGIRRHASKSWGLGGVGGQDRVQDGVPGSDPGPRRGRGLGGHRPYGAYRTGTGRYLGAPPNPGAWRRGGPGMRAE